MSGKRVLVLYGALLFCFAAVVCRLYWLCSDTAYGARAAAQSVVTLRLPARRGNFYDHRGAAPHGADHPLDGPLRARGGQLCPPVRLHRCRRAGSALPEAERRVPVLAGGGPGCFRAGRFLLAGGTAKLCAPLAVQLLGYLDGEGHGAAGLEAAFDDLLTGSGRGIPCSAPSTPRESCGPSPSSPPPTAGPWGYS